MLKVRKGTVPSIHGHRGSRGTHPENSLPAFQEAQEAGADFFEVDTHLSHDKIPIVFHDFEISSRTCRFKDGEKITDPLPVSSISWSEFSQYQIGLNPQPKFPNQKLEEGLEILSLEEVFQWMQSSQNTLGINIEIKTKPEESLASVQEHAAIILALLIKYDLFARAIVQSFDFRPLEFLRKKEAELTLSCLFEKKAMFAQEAKKRAISIVGPHYSLLEKETISECHRLGVEVLPWTVNEASDWRKLLEMGVDGLITDYPRSCLEAIRS